MTPTLTAKLLIFTVATAACVAFVLTGHLWFGAGFAGVAYLVLAA